MPLDFSSHYPPERHQPVFNAPPGTLWLCVALVVAFIAFELAPERWQFWLLDLFAFIPASFLAQFGDGGGFALREWVPPFSYAFLHGDLLHLIVNAGMLLAFGTVVEREAGTARFLAVFFATAAIAAVIQALATGPQPILVIGASGAGYGLIGASLPYLYRGDLNRGRRDAMLFIVAIMGLNLLFGVSGLGTFITGAEIAWQAHIGGFVGGLLLIPVLRRR